MSAAVRGLASAGLGRLRGRLWPAGFAPGISAILVKELRGRMRGRRAFVTLTVHLILVAGFAWMVQRIAEEQVVANSMFGGQVTYAAAGIGRSVFIGLIMLQTIIVAVLAPASTAGTISGERERQTLDLLAVTPISSLAIVLGKLLSSLTWVFILVLASVPITALVFLFGGVAPDDVVRGYLVVLATAVGLGSVGLFFSALVRRSGAATGLTFVVVLATLIGSLFVWFFLAQTSRDPMTGTSNRPPDIILWANPFVAQADVACGAEGTLGTWCGFISAVTGTEGSTIQPVPVPMPGVKDGFGTGAGGVALDRAGGVFDVNAAPPDGGVGRLADVAVDPLASIRDRFWPRTVATWLVIALVLTILSVQLVSPTRRWHLRLGFLRLIRRRSA